MISWNKVAVEVSFEDHLVPSVERGSGEGLLLQPRGPGAVRLQVVLVDVFSDFFTGDTDSTNGVSFWSVVGPLVTHLQPDREGTHELRDGSRMIDDFNEEIDPCLFVFGCGWREMIFPVG